MKDINVNLCANNEDLPVNRKVVIRRWSVRKVRRRPQNKDKQSLKIDKISTESNTVEDSVLFFGENIQNQELDSSLFVSSDEDSATSEDGNFILFIVIIY